MRFLTVVRRHLLSPLLAAAAFAAACGGETTGPNPAPTPGAAGRFVYAASASSSAVAGYSINASTGVLTPIGQVTLTSGARALAMAIDPAGRFVFIARTGGGIDTFAVNRTSGALTLVSGSPFDRNPESFQLTVQPGGRALWATRTANLAVDTLTIDSAIGTLSFVPSASLQLSFAPTAPAVSPDGRFFYFAAGALPRITTASVDATTARLTTGAAVDAPDVVRSMTADPAFNFFYVTTATPFSSNTLFVYRVTPSSGALTRLSGSAFAPGFDAATSNFIPDTVRFDPTGRIAFVLDRAARTGARSRGVFVFPVQSSGLLGPTVLGPFTTPSNNSSFTAGDPVTFALDSSGRYAFLADGQSSTISAFLVDTSNGGMTTAGGPVASPPAALIVVTP